MKTSVFLGVVMALLSLVDGVEVSTPRPKEETNNSFDFSDSSTKLNGTIGTIRPDPRQTEAPTPEQTPWVTVWIDYDQVKPFAQPEPETISEKAAIKFKPQIHIANGCHPYPAVNEAGETGGGLESKGEDNADCKGSGWGSQVYGRSTKYGGVWAFMYSWYFPKDPSPGLGQRHDWEHVVVWLDNPDDKEPNILGLSLSAHSGYSKFVPPHSDHVNGTSVKVEYKSNHALESTSTSGEFQDLIMWDQMSENARRALNSVSWGAANTPMNDGNFLPNLKNAWPFATDIFRNM